MVKVKMDLEGSTIICMDPWVADGVMWLRAAQTFAWTHLDDGGEGSTNICMDPENGCFLDMSIWIHGE